jgi:hypothetical protein
MTGVKLAGGVEIDLLGKEDFDGGLKLLGDRLAPRPADRSLRKTVARAVTMPGSGPALLDFGGPPSGTLWVPLWITLAGADDHTSVANSQFAVYLGGQATTNPSTANLWIPGGTAPQIPANLPTGGKDTVYAHFGDNVFVLVYGVAGDTQLQGVLRYREVHPSNIEELNILG